MATWVCVDKRGKRYAGSGATGMPDSTLLTEVWVWPDDSLGRGRWVHPDVPRFVRDRLNASRTVAARQLRPFRLVRLLSLAEAKRKAQAEALREAANNLPVELSRRGEGAIELVGVDMACSALEKRADDLWPARGGK